MNASHARTNRKILYLRIFLILIVSLKIPQHAR